MLAALSILAANLTSINTAYIRQPKLRPTLYKQCGDCTDARIDIILEIWIPSPEAVDSNQPCTTYTAYVIKVRQMQRVCKTVELNYQQADRTSSEKLQASLTSISIEDSHEERFYYSILVWVHISRSTQSSIVL
ncbi:uncharacterized protein LOC111267356 isoform X1 [Varroa jacobsoni]|uniref:uncharacterized protein LOC111267356 isoform X1 n=1 Tax=Varroa jacobsoni TaxID=62625 RepID=UPI000BF400A9|nr:uncharacterized protein LOC111267356 isoform X1 [Varroa jacobsoni]